MPLQRRSARAFTLIELLFALVIIGILASLGFGLFGIIQTKAHHIKDVAQLKEIGVALISRSQDNNGFFYTKNEIGNSSYRAYDDPMSLCQILLPYLDSPETWISPRDHPRTYRFKNSYAWSRANNVTKKSTAANPSLGNTILLWNNATFTEVTPKGRVAGGNGGPANASKEYHVKPWKGGTAQNWLYADGRVMTF
jgi:prepilin-type N-terminal cleavage/methylation domain-containing protein